MKSIRALWRIARCIWHVLHGAAVCAFVFPFLDAGARMLRVQWWSGRMLVHMGIRVEADSPLPAPPLLVLSNHVSWLDILAIDALQPVHFVSKADIRRWPLLGFIVACGGTLFIERERKRDALRVVHQIAAALEGGTTIAVFPEGTTGPGRRLLPFHANLLQAAIATGTRVQPVALRYADAVSAFSPAVEFVGTTTLVQSIWRIASAEALVVHVAVLPPMESTGAERRVLAEAVADRIQAVLDSAG